MEQEEYILAHGDAEPDYLAKINRKTHLKMINPRMLSGHLQGRVLSMLSKMIQPERILEVGTYTGYSALCLAEGLSAKGKLHTIECDDELEDFIRENIESSPYQKQIVLHIGDAKKLIPEMDEMFDLVFLDADKREYKVYYDAVFPKLRNGGFMLVDNTLWDGKVLLEQNDKDNQTEAIRQFNNYVAADSRVEKLILPLRDGLTMIRKK
ncbi:MAG: O-methyltransferase [Paludibacter sp.]|nr:O-methyltransferase [Paludibacter sp.]